MYSASYLPPLVFSFAIFFVLAPMLSRQNQWARYSISAIATFFLLRYSVWRLTETVFGVSPFTLSGAWIWGFFVIEFAVIVEFGVFLLIVTGHNNRTPNADEHEKRLRSTPDSELPEVDVFLPTYDERFEVLEKTIFGALALDYPNFTVWVLDDGNRDWLRDFCDKHDVNYLRRADDKHAKAGNMNAALNRTSAELIATFDADFVPKKNFLYRTVGFFQNDEVSIVQTPQKYFNLDFVQKNLQLFDSWPDDQAFFYDAVLPAKDDWNAATCCGSCSIHRRQALEDIGGYPTDVCLEDFPMSVKMKKNGWLTIYLSEKLSLGLAPDDTNAFNVQRSRWMRGGIQTMFTDYGPLSPGHKFVDRLFYLPFFWLNLIPFQMAIVLAPVLYLWFAIPPFILPSLTSAISQQGPWLFALFGTLLWVAPGEYRVFPWSATSLYMSILLFPTWVGVIMDPFGKYLGNLAGGFSVTPKERKDELQINYGPFIFSLVTIGLIAGGLVVNGFPEYAPLLAGGRGYKFLPMALFWGIYVFILLGLCAMMSIDLPLRRGEERFEIHEPIRCIEEEKQFTGEALNMSLSGSKVKFEENYSGPDEFVFEIPGVTRIRSRVMFSSGNIIGLKFLEPSDEQRRKLIQYIFTEPDFDPLRGEDVDTKKMWGALLYRLLGPTPEAT